MTTGGDTARNDIMEGIVTDWTRIPGGQQIQSRINEVIKQYSFEHPENSVDALVEIYKSIRLLDYKDMWKQQKMDEVKELIIHCSGIFAEATTRDEFILKGDTASVSLVINKRNNVDVQLVSVTLNGVYANGKAVGQSLKTNQNNTYEMKGELMDPAIGNATQPYWLQSPQKPGNFMITNPLLVGQAWNDALLNATLSISIKGTNFDINRPVQYKYIDPVKGEVYQPFIIIPHLSISLSPHVALLNVKTEKDKFSADSIYITYKSNFTAKNVPVTLYILQDTLKTVFEKNERRIYRNGHPV
jgi:hypothetical protein